MLELLQMWALVEVLGLMCLPLTITVFKNLPDRGWAFTKIVGMALLAFCVWLPLMTLQFLPFSQLFIFGVLLILLALNVIGFARAWNTLVQLVRTHLVYIVACELIFFGMMFLLGWIRSYGPDIRFYEMFMDEGFLSSIMRSQHFPPNDMWLSGYPINYYYYAHYTIAVLAKLLGQPSSIAFNTGICTFFGLTAVNIFGVTSNIVAWASHRRRSSEVSQAKRSPFAFLKRRTSATGFAFPSMLGAIPFGLISILMGLVLGNLASTQSWWKDHGDLPYYYWFNVSRVLDKTINEFPAFSFLLSCFHAHVLTLAFTILAIGLIFNLFLEQGDSGDPEDAKGLRVFGRGWRLFLNLGFMAIVLGGLFTMNGWDLPTYLGLALVCIALQQWLAYKRFCFELVLDVFTNCASLAALSFFFYAPFYLNFISPSQGVGIVGAADRSRIADEMLIYGTFMFLFVSLLLVNLLRDRSPASPAEAFQLAGNPGALPAVTSVSGDQKPLNGANGHANGHHGDFTHPDGTSKSGNRLNTASGSHAVVQGSQQFVAISRALLASTDEKNASSEEDIVEIPLAHSTSTSPAQSEEAEREETTSPRAGSPHWLTVRFVSQVLIIAAALLTLVLLKNSLWFVIVGCITALGVELTLYHLHDRPRAFTLLLGTVAFALVALTEIFYLKDVFAGNFPRMNTVFKFYFQAWALLAITSGAGMYFILESFRSASSSSGMHLWIRRGGQTVWSVVFLLLLLAGMVYPLVGTYQRYNQFAQRTNSLNGIDYLQSYSPGDYYAIQWLNSHVEGSPVIVEAFGPLGGDYSDYGRISAFTGLPTLIGWAGHEYQWRVNWLNNDSYAADFYQRGSDVNRIYTSKDPQTVLSILARYQATYLYVGNLEVATYAGSDLSRFRQFMPIVYQANGVTIYKVPGNS